MKMKKREKSAPEIMKRSAPAMRGIMKNDGGCLWY
jgi:hypothetical protein